MGDQELEAMVSLLRTHGTDFVSVEAKAATGGLPKSVRETLSAFSNDRGGTIILGLDERSGFSLATGFDTAKTRDALAATCNDEMEPPVRAEIEIVGLDGGAVVLARVPELDPRFKPCYVKARGEYNGSFTRGGDGDRRLTDFEIHLLHTNRGQPDDDRKPVQEATIDDLDRAEVDFLLRRLRHRQRRAFEGLDDTSVLRRIKAVVPGPAGQLVPTLAGLLCLGNYPQEFFPQLNVTFVVYPGLSAEDVPAGGPRFLDNRTIDGPVPIIVDEVIAAVLRNSSLRSFVEGAGRRDVYDYPIEAVREAVANALLHRDYSPYSWGTPVQVVLYPDRLVIANPGGLFGTVTEDDLGAEGVSSTRNPVLARLLQEVRLPDSDRTVCENRASGIPTMLRELRRSGSALPEFHNRITRFKVVMPRHALLDEPTLTWLEGLGALGLTPTQRMALAHLREGGSITNQTMRNLGLESHRATAELGNLVDRELAVRLGERRHARYVLAPDVSLRQPSAQHVVEPTSGTHEDRVLAAFQRPEEELTRRDLEQRTGLGQATLGRVINQLIAAGRLAATAPPRSPLRRYHRQT